MNDLNKELEKISSFASIDLLLETDVVNLPPKEQNQWLMSCGLLVIRLEQIEGITQKKKGEILYTVKRVWSNLSLESVEQWNYKFYNWARDFLAVNGLIGLSDNAINNHIRVYRDFKSEESNIKLPEVVTITKVENGKVVVNDKGEPEKIEIEPDINDATYSKMLASVVVAKNGKMDNEAWSQLFDSTVTLNQFESKINQLKENEHKESKPKSFHFYLNNGVLYIKSGSRTQPIFQMVPLDQDVEHEDLWLVGTEMILNPIGIDTPL